MKKRRLTRFNESTTALPHPTEFRNPVLSTPPQKERYLIKFSVAATMLALWMTSLLSAAELHTFFESSRTYMGYTRTTKAECWLGDQKSYYTREGSNHAWITRDDLKLNWLIHFDDSLFGEDTISDAPQPEMKEDIHTKGIDYEPEYEWVIKDLPEKKEINGFSCRGVSARGVADYADVNLTLWLVDGRSLEHKKGLHDLLTGLLRNESASKTIEKILQADSTTLLVQVDQVQEPAIAPTITNTIVIKKVSTETAPLGKFDIPSGFKRESNN